MRRSASEILNNLEMRIARLENRGDELFNRVFLDRNLKDVWLLAHNYIISKEEAYLLHNVSSKLLYGKKSTVSERDRIKALDVVEGINDARLSKHHLHLVGELIFLLDHDSFWDSDMMKGQKVIHDPRRYARLKRQANAIAATIVNQLGGGRKLQMFIGLKQLINERNGVTLVFPKPKHRGAVNRVRITLNGKDLYDMEFIRTHGRSVKVVREFNDVYAEDIKDRFEEGTGLYIRF